MVDDTLQLHCDKLVTMNINILLSETILPVEAALTIRTLLIDFFSLIKT